MASESKLLANWQLKLAILSAIVVPTVTATGAFYDIQTKISDREAKVNERISAVELRAEQNFADKPAMQKIQSDLQSLKEDMVEVKTLLKRR